MERHVMWAQWEGPGLEHLVLTQRPDGITADGLIIGVRDGQPVRIRYTIMCDERRRMRRADVLSVRADRREIHLRTDGNGRWATARGEALPELAGCMEVDISATPFTNTLPIRRLALQPGATAGVPAAYIDIADFTITRVPQRYTLLEAPAGETRYRYHGVLWDFRADLPVDDDGLVTDYPGLFRRVWAG